MRAARLGPRTWLDLARATLELAIANHRLGSRTVKDLLLEARKQEQIAPSQDISDYQRQLIARVAFAVPHIGARAPWRSDCLVQAMAAQRWLLSKEITATLYVGVRKETRSEFEAHAWLKVGEEIVTGGDITGFVPLITPETELPPQG